MREGARSPFPPPPPLLRRYADVLEQELRDPTFVAETETQSAEAGRHVPFERARGVAAA
jgi:hypothetical protein